MVRRPPRGYLPEPTKSILVVYPWSVPQEEVFFRGYGLQIVRGARYLRGFLGSTEAQDCWLGEKVEGWRDSVATLVGVACRQPHTTYTGLQKSLQQEWAFVQRVTPDIGIYFQAVEYKLRYTFLPALFQGATSQIPGEAITGMLVN